MTAGCARMPTGWRCIRIHIDGPCAGLPRWWNLPARWRGRTVLR